MTASLPLSAVCRRCRRLRGELCRGNTPAAECCPRRKHFVRNQNISYLCRCRGHTPAAADILKVFSHCPSKKMWQFSIAKDDGQHSFLVWITGRTHPAYPMPRIRSGVGYCIVCFAMGSPQPSLRQTKSAPHFFCFLCIRPYSGSDGEKDVS